MPIKFIKKNKFNVACGKFIKTSEKGVQVKISLPNNMVKSHDGNLLEFYNMMENIYSMERKIIIIYILK